MQNPLAIPSFVGFSTPKITHSIPRRPFIDLPEDRRRVIDDGIHCTAKQPARRTPYLLGKGELGSRKNANRRADIFRRSEPSSAEIEAVGCQFVANFGRT
jgi:hypothetical protein